MREIEIYLRADPAPILRWLEQLCAEPPALRVRAQGKLVTRAGRCTLAGTAEAAAQGVAVLVVEAVADGFTSVSFTAPALPWADDIDCARAAAAAIGCEARCNASAWSPDAGDDDDGGWYAITPSGERAIRWRTE